MSSHAADNARAIPRAACGAWRGHASACLPPIVKEGRGNENRGKKGERVKVELGYTLEGFWQECALCGEGFRAYEVEAHTELPGEHCARPVCRQCALAGEQGLRQRLIVRASELRRLAGQLEQVCEEGVEVPTLSELHNLERRKVSPTPLDLLDFDEP